MWLGGREGKGERAGDLFTGRSYADGYRRMGRRADGQTGGQADRQTGRQTDRRTDGQTDSRTVGHSLIPGG